MKVVTPQALRIFTSLAACLCLAPAASALLRMNDGRDQVYVTLNAGVSYDSNIYTVNGGSGDFIYNSGLSIDYLRRAGMIGINSNIGWGFSKFAQFSGEDFATPSMSLEFTKSTGRTTGSLTMSASRSTQPDSNTNLRIEAWNYRTGLSLRYPVIERYSVVGQFSYSLTDYTDNSTVLVDLPTYTASSDIYYAWTSERDLFFGYRYRWSDPAIAPSYDHNLSVGVSGKILSKLNGSARIGYQTRTAKSATGGPTKTTDGINASISSTWTVNRRVSVTATLARDFKTTSTASNTESTTLTLNTQYAVNARFSLNAQASAGRNDYIDAASGNRRDTYYSAGVGFSYMLNPHLSVNGSYDYFTNTSNSTLSEYDRNIFSLNLSSRW